jgi:hypothetical protein
LAKWLFLAFAELCVVSQTCASAGTSRSCLNITVEREEDGSDAGRKESWMHMGDASTREVSVVNLDQGGRPSGRVSCEGDSETKRTTNLSGDFYATRKDVED